MIISGDAWPHQITSDLVETVVGGRTQQVFARAPLSVATLLVETAAKYPDRVALVEDDGRTISYSSLVYESAACATVLAEKGVAAGTRVGLLLENSIEFVSTFLALNSLGAVTCPLPGKYRSSEILSLVEQAGIALVVCEDDYSPTSPTPVLRRGELVRRRDGLVGEVALAPICRNGGPEATALLMFTSGTTSSSKRVLLTNRNVVHAAVAYQRVLGLTPKDRSIIAVPMYHITGMVGIITTMLRAGAPLFIQKRFRPRDFLRAVQEERITFIHGSPTVFALLAKERESFPSLPTVRMLACGAAHMPVSLIGSLHQWMPEMEFRTIYGLTETSSPATVFPVDAATSPHVGSSGVPVPGVEVEIRTFDGRPAQAREAGEVWVRGTCVTAGYDGERPGEADEPALDTLSVPTPGVTDPSPSPDGWLRTGDVGYATEDGYLYVVDRTKNMVNRGGEKVWCSDVEEALRAVPGVADACVVGLPDPVYGEVPAALLVASGDTANPSDPDGQVDAANPSDPGDTATAGETASADDGLDVQWVRSALKGRLASFEIPVYVQVVEALPTTVGMKIDKKEARRLLQEGRS